MEVDRTRYALYAGLCVDLYFDFGLFVTPRTLIAVPILAPIADSRMRLALEFSLAAGYAF